MERLTYKHDNHYCVSGINGKLVSDKHANYWGEAINLLAEYEDIGATPDELKTAVYLYLELSQKMRRIVKDMKYYLDANEEDGVVYIPKFVVEEIAYGK